VKDDRILPTFYQHNLVLVQDMTVCLSVYIQQFWPTHSRTVNFVLELWKCSILVSMHLSWMTYYITVH